MAVLVRLMGRMFISYTTPPAAIRLPYDVLHFLCRHKFT